MKHTQMIVRWNGLVPVVDDIPKMEIIWDIIGCFMDRVRTMGIAGKPVIRSLEV